MNVVTPWLKQSQYIAPLSPACKMCARGTKMVVLVTGLCSAQCFYCPLSKRKIGKDRIFANEWELENENETLVFYLPPRKLKTFLRLIQETLGNRQIVIAREMTKIYEEFVRGTTAELLKIIDKITIKGEMTVLIDNSSKLKRKKIEKKNSGVRSQKSE